MKENMAKKQFFKIIIFLSFLIILVVVWNNKQTYNSDNLEQPSKIVGLPTEVEINDNPYIQHIRLALNGYLNGTNAGVEKDALNTIGEMDCGLSNFDRTYYQSKFIILDASDANYGGVQADIVFVDKPDAIFWIWVYRLEGDGEYVLRSFCKNGPPENQKAEFKKYIYEKIINTKYIY